MQNEMQSQNPDGQRETVPDTTMPEKTAQAIRRYMEIQREMARLEQEKEDLRNLIAKELDGQIPTSWRPMLDAKPLRLHPRRCSLRHHHRPFLRRYVDFSFGVFAQ